MNDNAILDMLRMQAKAMNIDLETLASLAREAAEDTPGTQGTMPTVAEWHPKVAAMYGRNTRRTYETYWNRLVAELGDRRLDDVRTSDLRAVFVQVKEEVEQRHKERTKSREAAGKRAPQKRTGTGAQENFVAASRAFFQRAVDDEILRSNPAANLKKPKRRPRAPRSLKAPELQQMWDAVRSGGNDPELDCLIVRFRLETACRAGGILNLTVADLLVDTCKVRLHEKNEDVREQPVSRTLMDALLEHVSERGPVRGDGTLPNDSPVFHYKRRRNGQPHPLTRKRFEVLFERLRRQLPWAKESWLRAHDLRHTTLTAVERSHGYATAKAFAGHADQAVTEGYVRATEDDVRRAHQHLVGEVVGPQD